jgi:hypothetical protein
MERCGVEPVFRIIYILCIDNWVLWSLYTVGIWSEREIFLTIVLTWGAAGYRAPYINRVEFKI